MKGLIVFLALIFLSGSVFAVSGVSPSVHEVDFASDLEKEFVFEFVMDGFRIYDLEVKGELSQFVTLDREKVASRQKVVATLNLPSSGLTPGPNDIKIVAGGVEGIIRVNVPYPERYVDLDLNVPDVNIGEIINIELGVINRGVFVEVDPRLEFYRATESGAEIINVMGLNNTWVRDSYMYEVDVVPGGYSAGEYFVVAYADYGEGVTKINNSFRVGEKRVELVNYTTKSKENRISKFNIYVQSFWNTDINSVYAQVDLVGTDYSFVTPGVKLGAWETVELSGFIDARGMDTGNKRLQVTIFYDGDSSEEVVQFRVFEGFDLIFVLVILGSLGSIFVIVFMWIRFRRNVGFIEEQ